VQRPRTDRARPAENRSNGGRSRAAVAGSDARPLERLYTLASEWGRGTGPALMHAALTSLRQHSYLEAVLWVLAENARARRFYERCGFVEDAASAKQTCC
jgi:GNAT superfamily N-acetyltransferase